MKMEFQTVGTNTFLTVELEDSDVIDTMSLGMLTNNAIEGIAPATFMQVDTAKFIRYNVSSMVSATELFSRAVNKKRLLGFFAGIVDAIQATEDYMLDTDSLLLDLDYIFVDVSTCKTVTVCLPVMNGEHKNPELGVFFKNIIFNTQFDQTENCDHVAQILNYLNSNPSLSLVDFKELLERISKPAQAPAKPAQQPVQQPVRPSAPVAAVQQPAAPQNVTPAPVVNNPQPSVQPQNVPSPVKMPPVPNMQNRNPAPQPVSKTPAGNGSNAQPAGQDEKPMSMFYLLQHYNKENAAIYKAQQDSKKSKKAKESGTPVPGKPIQLTSQAPQKPANAGVQTPGKQPPAPPAFNVPGKQPPAPPAFAVPGKQEAVSPAFAVPGKQQPAAPAFAAPAPQMPAAPAFSAPAPQKPVAPVQQPVAPKQDPVPMYQQPAQPSNPINFGETTVLGGAIGETTVLGASAEPKKAEPYLIRAKNNERIPLNKPVFRIGKERSYVDYFVSDNTAISRSHANIVNHNGSYFVVDTNSTNHTYVNGGMIQSGAEVPLSHGTKIRLANEDFEFNMY